MQKCGKETWSNWNHVRELLVFLKEWQSRVYDWKDKARAENYPGFLVHAGHGCCSLCLVQSWWAGSLDRRIKLWELTAWSRFCSSPFPACAQVFYTPCAVCIIYSAPRCLLGRTLILSGPSLFSISSVHLWISLLHHTYSLKGSFHWQLFLSLLRMLCLGKHNEKILFGLIYWETE